MWIMGPKRQTHEMRGKSRRNFSMRRAHPARNPDASHRRGANRFHKSCSALPTRGLGTLRIRTVGSFPFDLASAASHNVTIAVLRIGDPEPRGNAVRGTRSCNSGAAPATVNGKPLSIDATEVKALGRRDKRRRPVSQETCRDHSTSTGGVPRCVACEETVRRLCCSRMSGPAPTSRGFRCPVCLPSHLFLSPRWAFRASVHAAS